MSHASIELIQPRRDAQKDPAEARLARKDPARSRTHRLPPPVRFVDDAHRAGTIADAERARAIVLMPVCLGPGHLKSAIDADLESVLASRGAMPSQVHADAPYRAVVEDQLARAASLPVRGVCLSMPTLADLCEVNDSLNEDDLRTLSVWVEAAKVQRKLRVVVLLSEIDRDTTLLVPRRLEEHLFPARAESELTPSGTVTVSNSFADTPQPPAVALAPEPAALSGVEEPVETTDREPAPLVGSLGPRTGDTLRPPAVPDLDLGEALAQALSGASNDAIDDPADAVASEDVAPTLAVDLGPLTLEDTATVEVPALPPPSPAPAAPRVREMRVLPRRKFELARESARVESSHVELAPANPVAETVVETNEREAAELDTQAKPADLRRAMTRLLRDEAPPAAEMLARVEQSATYRNFALDLDAAKGPKPVAVIEKLFAQRYVPLLGAAARGELDGAAMAIAESWRASFAESYENAYPSMRATGKRPTMVMDAPDVATRVARLASARSIKLVLVDSMSFDLGARVEQRIAKALDKRAVLVESSTLWSALPTRSYQQMHLLAKGPEGLKDPISGPPSEPDVTRGRALATLRRERCGSRELLKLDLVEARLRVQGPGYDERLDAIADEVADVLVKFMETQPPRTLVYVFGDHGFVLGQGSNGWATGTAVQGGSSPEEVLVPGYGFLVDAVQ